MHANRHLAKRLCLILIFWESYPLWSYQSQSVSTQKKSHKFPRVRYKTNDTRFNIRSTSWNLSRHLLLNKCWTVYHWLNMWCWMLKYAIRHAERLLNVVERKELESVSLNTLLLVKRRQPVVFAFAITCTWLGGKLQHGGWRCGWFKLNFEIYTTERVTLNEKFSGWYCASHVSLLALDNLCY